MATLVVAASQAFVQGLVARAQLTATVPGVAQPAELDALVVAAGLAALVAGTLVVLLVAGAVGQLTRLVLRLSVLGLGLIAVFVAVSAPSTVGETLTGGALALVLMTVSVLTLVGLGTILATVAPPLGRPLRAWWHAIRPAPVKSVVPAPAEADPVFMQADVSVLDVMLDLMRRLDDQQTERTTTIERKATTLVSALGIAAAFTVNVSGLIFGSDGLQLGGAARVVVLVSFVVTAVTLAIGLLFAIRAARVVYWMAPQSENLLDMDSMDLSAAKRTELLATYKTRRYNQQRNNELAADLNMAQRLIVVAGVSILVFALTLAANSVIN